MRAMLLKTNGKVSLVDLNTLDEIYDAIGCRTIDIVRDITYTSFGTPPPIAHPQGRNTPRGPTGVYDLIVDDDGLADESLAVNALAMWYFGVALVGNILVAMHDGAGNRTAYEGPLLPDMRPASGFTFVPLNDGPTPKATNADDGSCDNSG